jgi:hypothetical protein
MDTKNTTISANPKNRYQRKWECARCGQSSNWLNAGFAKTAALMHEKQSCIVVGDKVVLHHADTPGIVVARELIETGRGTVVVRWEDDEEQIIDKDQPQLMRALEA